MWSKKDWAVMVGWGGVGEPRRGYNLVNFFIDFFHVSYHLDQFGGVSFFLQKINYLNGWGEIP